MQLSFDMMSRDLLTGFCKILKSFVVVHVSFDMMSKSEIGMLDDSETVGMDNVCLELQSKESQPYYMSGKWDAPVSRFQMEFRILKNTIDFSSSSHQIGNDSSGSF